MVGNDIKKIFENEFTKNVKDLYTENCKTLMKEIQEDTNKLEDFYIHGWEEFLKYS